MAQWVRVDNHPNGRKVINLDLATSIEISVHDVSGVQNYVVSAHFPNVIVVLVTYRGSRAEAEKFIDRLVNAKDIDQI